MAGCLGCFSHVSGCGRVTAMGWKDLFGKYQDPGGEGLSASQPAASIDHPLILSMVFHPRRDAGPSRHDGRVQDRPFSLQDGTTIGSRFYVSGPEDPVILFFHGNGEIASDYDDIAGFFTSRCMNLLVADYRGYGRSTGTPTLTGMVQDAREVFRCARQMLNAGGFNGPLWVMGRSLGSASAIEVARNEGESIAGLIVESGFADTVGLLRRVGIPLQGIPIPESWVRFNLDSIAKVPIPTLIIHGEWDQIIPVTDGEALYRESAAVQKEILVIPEAGHNDLLWVGMEEYMGAVARFVSSSVP
jgi:fermentation-respiration switch protein FrsA (DUF1100 family)